jgi:hypothetical protein
MGPSAKFLAHAKKSLVTEVMRTRFAYGCVLRKLTQCGNNAGAFGFWLEIIQARYVAVGTKEPMPKS